jgi:hypothetical protein
MKIRIKINFCPGELSKDHPLFEENFNCVERFVALPGENVVCWRCNGAGAHVNPAIDGNGISPEEFHEDPDFAESYFGGVYDITCEECNGDRVVGQANEKAFSQGDREIYKQHLDYLEADRAWLIFSTAFSIIR